jgi:hypothetical protein
MTLQVTLYEYASARQLCDTIPAPLDIAADMQRYLRDRLSGGRIEAARHSRGAATHRSSVAWDEMAANLDGYVFTPNVSLPAHQRAKLENLCRYMLRPPLAVDRLERLAAASRTR